MGSLLGSKWFIIGAAALAIWLFGGMDFVFNNPIILIFGGLILLIVMVNNK